MDGFVQLQQVALAVLYPTACAKQITYVVSVGFVIRASIRALELRCDDLRMCVTGVRRPRVVRRLEN